MNQEALDQPWRTSILAPESVLGLSCAAIYATDTAGTITYYNEAAVEVWGVRPTIGKTQERGLWKLFSPNREPLSWRQSPMAICLSENRVVENVEIIVQRTDGKEMHIIMNPRPYVDNGGVMLGAVNTLVDVSVARKAERAQKQSDEFNRLILANSQDCMKVLDLNGRILSINACGVRGLEINNPEDGVGLSYFDFWNEEDREVAREAARHALKTGVGRFTADYQDSCGRITSWDEVISVYNDELGSPAGFIVISRDITERHRAEIELSRRLHQQKVLAEIGALALSTASFQEVLQNGVELLAKSVECSLAKVLEFADHADQLLLRAGIGWKEGLVGNATVGTDLESQAGFTLQAGTPIVVKDLLTETRFNGPNLLRDHGVRSGMSVTIAGAEGRPFGVLGVHTTALKNFEPSDVDFLCSVANIFAARVRQEESSKRRTLLLREMAHRSGNLLQLASSIFLQTIRSTPDLKLAQSVFTQRLTAMGRVNNIVAKDGWGKTSIRAVAHEALEPFMEKIKLSGRDIVLPADLCFDIGLIWHELATNSAKYGSFSQKEGEVSISWRVKPHDDNLMQRLILSWEDQCPRVARTTPGIGFGSRLLSQIIEKKYSGKIEVRTEPTYGCMLELLFRPEVASGN